MNRTLFFSSLVGLALAWQAAAQTPSTSPSLPSSPPGVEWARELGEESGQHSAQALALSSKDGSFAIAGISTVPGRSSEPGSFWLWRLDPAGGLRQEIRIGNPHGERRLNPAYRYVGGIAMLEDGGALLVLEFIEREPSLVRLDAAGKVVFVKPAGERGTVIAKLVSAGGGRFLLLGGQGQDAIAIKVDAQGNRIWVRRFDHGEHEAFVDGMATEDGGFVAVANKGPEDPGLADHVWVLRCNRDGDRESEAILAGRNGRVARAPDGYRVLYDEQQDMFARDAWLQAFDPGLRPLWRVSLLGKEPGSPKAFGIAALPGGGLVLAGSKGVGLWLCAVDAKGRQAWSWWDSPEPHLTAGAKGGSWHWDFRAIAVSGPQVFVVSSVQRVGGEAGFKVGLMKLVQR